MVAPIDANLAGAGAVVAKLDAASAAPAGCIEPSTALDRRAADSTARRNIEAMVASTEMKVMVKMTMAYIASSIEVRNLRASG